MTFGEPTHKIPSPAIDNRSESTMAAETPKHGYEDLCAELDARPPSPLRLDELPQKQADIVRTFMKHGVEPPSCTPIPVYKNRTLLTSL